MDMMPLLIAFLSAVLMGTIGVFSKLTGLPAEVITFFRLAIGAGFMALFLLCIRKVHLLNQWPTWPVLVNGCFLAGFIIFYVQAMNFTSMANAIMLVYLAPLAAALAAHFFLGERLTLGGFGLIGLALFGFAMMMEFQVDISRDSGQFWGLCLGSLAMFCYAGFILVNRIIPVKIHVFTRTFYQLLTGAVVMAPLVLPSIGGISGSDIPWLIATGLVPGFFAILFAVMALSRLPAATFGTIAYSEPVAVVIFGWTIFQESLSVLQFCGCLLIIASGILKTLTSRSGDQHIKVRSDLQ